MAFNLADFTYTLPPELVAQTPCEPRDSARLLCWPEGRVRVFRELPDLLNPGDVLIINQSHVIPARLHLTRPGRAGGTPVPVEVLLHQAHDGTLHTWQAFAKPTKRLRVGDVLELNGQAVLHVAALGGPAGQITVQFRLENIPAFLEAAGRTPLPPYIKTADSAAIRARYQTVYAEKSTSGSVAAPTAGLHFTPAVFAGLHARGIEVHAVVLHVGAGTFLNPTPEQVAAGRLHAEWAHVPASTAAAIVAARARGNAVIAVGTTSLRTLESWALATNMTSATGVIPAQAGTHDKKPARSATVLSPTDWQATTQLFIQPGFEFKVVDKLITNFHLPESSLLMLVAAFLGGTPTAPHAWKPVYDRAIAEKFKFFSFGESSLLTRG